MLITSARCFTAAKIATFAAATVAALAACGGGSSNAAGPPSTTTPSASPTTSAQGVVRDLGAQRYANDGNAAGAPIAGATVVVGPTLVDGATPPATYPTGDAHTTTQSDGSYTLAGFATGTPTYAIVLPPVGDPHVASHALAKLGVTQTLYLYAPSTAETAELTQINLDRSNNAAGPVLFDEIAFETARAHADFMATNGYYAHCIPMSNCAPGVGIPPTSFPPQYASPDDLYNFLGGALQLAPAANHTENFAFNVTTWSVADGLFMAEKGTADQSHFDNIVFPTHSWVGLGGNPSPQPPAAFGLFLQEFY